MAVALLFIALGAWFVIWTAYKPIYDTVETAAREFDWRVCFQAAFAVIPGLALGFMETIVFAAISVAISTRIGILPNFLICFAIYVLGHLTPLIVQSPDVASSFASVVFIGQVISIIFPVLDHFDIQTAINTNSTVPLTYIGWSAVYCTLYSTIAMLLGLTLFEDRDLA